MLSEVKETYKTPTTQGAEETMEVSEETMETTRMEGGVCSCAEANLFWKDWMSPVKLTAYYTWYSRVPWWEHKQLYRQ